MTNSIKVFVLSFTIFLANNTAFAQELQVGISTNPTLSSYLHEDTNKDIRGGDTIKLPFFDDFSHGEVFPRQDMWQDNYVFVNTKFANGAPSVGFATFDLLNAFGAVYPDASYQFAFEADLLTSRTIALDAAMNDVVLSFYYRPQGNGDAPETKDSLLLDFFAEETGEWHNVWAKEGKADHNFTKVSIPITQEKYLKKGFKFRFRNYASLGASSYASMAGNADQWHIDMVYLNKNRSDNDIHEIAFTNSLNSMLADFESIPWEHYKSLQSEDEKKAIMTDEVALYFRNLDNSLRSFQNLKLNIEDLSGNIPNEEISYTSFNQPPTENTILQKFNPDYFFPENNDDEATFLVSMAFDRDNPNDSTANNTISRKQVFSNYYAYDDGTAEAGYGLTGTGTKFGQVAYQFTPLKADAIIGVEIYFCQTLNDASKKYFWLDVREKSTEGDYPASETIYQLEGVRPEYEDKINKFHYYEFPEPVYVTSDFYVGWTQTTDDLLNVGLDINGDSKSKMKFNIGNGWQDSQIDGAVMIRPVFHGNYAPTKSISQEFSTTELPAEIGPNPVADILKIMLPQEYDTETINISVVDLYGKKILEIKKTDDREINFSNFPKGIYLLTITSESGNFVRRKVVKS